MIVDCGRDGCGRLYELFVACSCCGGEFLLESRITGNVIKCLQMSSRVYKNKTRFKQADNCNVTCL